MCLKQPLFSSLQRKGGNNLTAVNMSVFTKISGHKDGHYSYMGVSMCCVFVSFIHQMISSGDVVMDRLKELPCFIVSSLSERSSQLLNGSYLTKYIRLNRIH